MTIQWTDDLPIYRQLMNEIISWILSGKLREGDPLPSTRKMASQFQINPLTVSKAYQELSHNELVEKRRGVGLFVCAGTRKILMRTEKEKFLQEELPRILKRMEEIGIDPEMIASSLKRNS